MSKLTPVGTMIQVGNHLWARCGDCEKLVKLTGWLRGMHLCLTPEELAAKNQARYAVAQQRSVRPPGDLLATLLGSHGNQGSTGTSGSAQSEAP